MWYVLEFPEYYKFREKLIENDNKYEKISANIPQIPIPSKRPVTTPQGKKDNKNQKKIKIKKNYIN